MEVKRCTKEEGWLGWLHQEPPFAVAALRYLASQGDQLPDDLEELRDAIAQFGFAPIEQAAARVIGLEAAFAEIAELMRGRDIEGPLGRMTGRDVQRVQAIVRTCVQFSGDFGPAEEEEPERVQ